MENNKLYHILSTFNRYEQNRLRKFVQSPYFNKHEGLIQLFDIMIEDINKVKKKEIELTKEKVWVLLFKKEKYDDQRFRKLNSELLTLVEDYLAQQAFERNEAQRLANLFDEIAQRKLEKLYNSTKKKALLVAERYINRNVEYYYQHYLIERGVYTVNNLELNRADKSNLEAIIKQLDTFYIAEKLRQYTSMMARKLLVMHDYKIEFIEEIINHVRNSDYSNVPPVAIYFQIYLAMTENNNEEHYYVLKSLIDQYIHEFPPDEATTICVSALNYCVGKINKGSKDFLKEYLNMYKAMVERDIILENGIISPFTFNNVVLAALRNGDYTWAEKFIKDFQDKLPSESKENVVSFNSARLYFYQKKYDKVLRLLQTVEYEDRIYNLASKNMLMHIYYEQDEVEVLYSLLDSYKTYLNRHKDIPEKRRKTHANDILFIRKLTKVMPGNKKDIEKIKNELIAANEKDGVASFALIMEKIKELE